MAASRSLCNRSGAAPPPRHGEAGFSLVETVVATVLLAVALVSLAQLFAVSTSANFKAKTTTAASVMAQEKMEQLRALAWSFDRAGLPVSDVSSDTSVDPPLAAGGKGLTASPASALQANTTGYFDYVDANGRALGAGGTVPDGALYVRRWSIDPLPANPVNSLVIQVHVFRLDGRADSFAEGQAVRRFPEEARLVTVKTRKGM